MAYIFFTEISVCACHKHR